MVFLPFTYPPRSLGRGVTVVTGTRARDHGAKSVRIAILLISRRCVMCLGVPGQIIEVTGKTALTDFWGTRKVVKLDGLTERVVPGDYILNHAGSAVRKIDPELAAETMALYEVLLCEAGEDPLATDVVDELEEAETLELVSA
jgi:hydrogenase expression/formation protein HypC